MEAPSVSLVIAVPGLGLRVGLRVGLALVLGVEPVLDLTEDLVLHPGVGLESHSGVVLIHMVPSVTLAVRSLPVLFMIAHVPSRTGSSLLRSRSTTSPTTNNFGTCITSFCI